MKVQSGEGADQGSSSEPLPPDSLDINVDGQEISGPERGFGQLWRKTYRIRLEGANASPVEVIRTWRDRYGELWPEGNHFYRPFTGLKPGQVAIADLEMPANRRLSTGVVVTSVEPTSFSFVTPQGHTMAGDITFSAHDESGTTIAQIEILLRASDPAFELGMLLGGHKREDAFWEETLSNLAELLGADGTPETTSILLDSHRQWRNAVNIVNNSFLRTTLYLAIRPLRRMYERITTRNRQS
ncbi:MAG TPA: hypothetical protein VD789_00890 [Thermomicrobiales bacterium]|nr:hypothetical protein [Thermomicrobiales bacterium]